MTSACPALAVPATLPGVPIRQSHHIQLTQVPGGFRVTRPGARFAIERRGEEHSGGWLPDGEPLRAGWVDAFPEDVARAVLPLLRRLESAASGKGGRKASEPTTPDGKLIARACKRLGLSAAALGEAIGANESVLSRARHGELPAKHREAIAALLKGASKPPPRRSATSRSQPGRSS